MQRTFVAITLALTLSCALASSIATTNYVKGPIVVVQDNETNYTNSSFLLLSSINAGEVDLLASRYTVNNATPPVNTSANTWSVVYRKLDGKALSGTANTTFNFTGGQLNTVFYSNGYAVTITTENDTTTGNIPQITLYQAPVSGAAALARITLTNNTNQSLTPVAIQAQAIGKVVYIFYNVTETQINVTSFTIGGAKGSLVFNLTTSYNQTGSPLSVAWGEALGSNQLYANWQEGSVQKYSVIDVTKGTRNATDVGAWVDGYRCQAFSTDKKYYGDLCSFKNITTVNGSDASTISFYVRFNSSSLLPLPNASNLNATTNSVPTVFPYGPFIALFYRDAQVINGSVTFTHSYEILNLEKLTTEKTKTTFLTTSVYSSQVFRVVSGGIYTLTDLANIIPGNETTPSTQYFSNIQVGLVLGSSYLTSVLGFIMTIVAGVLLF